LTELNIFSKGNFVVPVLILQGTLCADLSSFRKQAAKSMLAKPFKLFICSQ